MLQAAAGLWLRVGMVLGNKCTPLPQPGWGELSMGQLISQPHLSGGCFGWMLRASPKAGQRTQAVQLGALRSTNAHCLLLADLGWILAAFGADLSSLWGWAGACGAPAHPGWSQHSHR